MRIDLHMHLILDLISEKDLREMMMKAQQAIVETLWFFLFLLLLLLVISTLLPLAIYILSTCRKCRCSHSNNSRDQGISY